MCSIFYNNENRYIGTIINNEITKENISTFYDEFIYIGKSINIIRYDKVKFCSSNEKFNDGKRKDV